MAQFTIDQRPQTLDEMFGMDMLKRYFTSRRQSGKGFPTAILLHGNYGSGKTTTAKILAKMMTCPHCDANGNPCNQCPDCLSVNNETFERQVIRIVGGQDGKADILSRIDDFTSTPAWNGGSKVVIVEESQNLSSAAVKSLLVSMETPTNGIHYIFLTMDQAKASAFTSRCVPFAFNPFTVAQIMQFLKKIMEKNNLWDSPDIPKDFKVNGLITIAQNSDGSLRQAEQILEQALDLKAFTTEELCKCTGFADTQTIISVMTDLMNNVASDALFNYFSNVNSNFSQDLRLLAKVINDCEMYRTFHRIPGENPYLTGQAARFLVAPCYPEVKQAVFTALHNYSLTKAEYVAALCSVFDMHHQRELLSKAEPAPIQRQTVPAQAQPTAPAVRALAK